MTDPRIYWASRIYERLDAAAQQRVVDRAWEIRRNRETDTWIDALVTACLEHDKGDRT